MKAAFVIMSILGCNDSGANCLPVATISRQWPTIALCDAASEKELSAYTNVNYPMVVAVCQTADTTALSDSEDDAAALADLRDHSSNVPEPPAAKKARIGLASRALTLFYKVVPSRKALFGTLEKPVHVVTDTYSWVARKIAF
jgi:hypothetical protein